MKIQLNVEYVGPLILGAYSCKPRAGGFVAAAGAGLWVVVEAVEDVGLIGGGVFLFSKIDEFGFTDLINATNAKVTCFKSNKNSFSLFVSHLFVRTRFDHLIYE